MNGKAAFFGLVVVMVGGAAGWFARDVLARREHVSPDAAKSSPAEVTAPASELETEPVAPPAEPSVSPVPVSPLEQAFAEWMGAPQLAGALVGFCVFDETGALLYSSPLAETALCPASALKSVTAGAAFGLLGPEFRFRTKVLGGSAISPAGSITGNLVLMGGGDPTLASEDLASLAQELVVKGLKRVDGRLVADATVFPAEPVNEHWNWGDIGNAYGTGAYGLNVDHNVMSLWFDPGAKEGDVAKLGGSIPNLRGVRWDAAVATGPAGSGDRVMIFSSPYAEVVQVRGTVPLGEKGFTVRGSVPHPPRLAEDILRAALVKRGVVFANGKATKDSTVELAVHASAPLPEIISHMQRVSDNLEAQCLFLEMGRQAAAPPVEVLRSYWEKAGVHFTGLRLIDGSGLARATMITPVDLARVNIAAVAGPHGDLFLQGLPASQDGVLRAKRGAMSGVKTEAGFIIRNGRRYPFALMANGLGADVDFWKLRLSLLDAVGR